MEAGSASGPAGMQEKTTRIEQTYNDKTGNGSSNNGEGTIDTGGVGSSETKNKLAIGSRNVCMWIRRGRAQKAANSRTSKLARPTVDIVETAVMG